MPPYTSTKFSDHIGGNESQLNPVKKLKFVSGFYASPEFTLSRTKWRGDKEGGYSEIF
jgi:hypothetical protein